MIKKLLVAVVAAGALSVPLAGAAWSDPGSPQSGGGQGTGNPQPTGPPGNFVSTISHEAGGHTGQIFKEFTGGSPGQFDPLHK